MEKLIMLLDIYEEEVVWVHSVWDKITEKEEAWICSKKFGFIKWLVDNDKIDRPKAWLKIKDLWDEYWWFGIYSWIHIECLIMLLSIQDNSIEFLISILK